TPLLFSGIVLALSASTGQAAQVKRAFVSANGSDANDCARLTPCRTLSAAIGNAVAGGEIFVLDPAGYGPVVITKAISIFNDGIGSAGILVPSGANGITINAGPADEINLRGFIIEGAGIGATGIVFNSGKSLTIENSVIRNLTDYGISFLPTAASTLNVSNTYIANNGDTGICLLPLGSAPVQAVFNRVELYRNGTSGVIVSAASTTGSVTATAIDSVSAYNGTNGFAVLSGNQGRETTRTIVPAVVAGSAPASLTMLRSLAANNATGLFADGPTSVVRTTQSAVVGNTTGWAVSGGGLVLSAGDNTIEGNLSGESVPSAYSTK
ncbi:MAG: hypothetical protein QOI12_5286, partial [Alphaproteobacteria bacterium]|nr:hypothetical protein [Alphaproteobacteria bacterium]